MGIHTYPQSSLINEITFKKSEGGQTRAYLQAGDAADPKTLHDITCEMAKQGWQATPYNMGGKPVLEVLGFGSEGKLTALLKTHGWAQGAAEEKEDPKHKISLIEQVKKRSLAASGAFYLVGDASFTRYGYSVPDELKHLGTFEKLKKLKLSDKLNMGAGLMYGAGTASLLGFGRKDQTDLQVRDIAKKLDTYLKENGDEISDKCSLEAIAQAHNRGGIRKADDLFRQYPSEMMNLFFAGAGALIAASAYRHMNSEVSSKSIQEVFQRKRLKNPAVTFASVEKKMNKYHKLEGGLDIGLGALTGATGIFATLVKEKAPDPDAPPKHGMDAVWEKIQQKPLVIAGAGYMASTMCHAVSTALAWSYADSERRKTVPWRATFIGANIIAELLLAISSKGHGHGVKSDGSVDDTIISLASEAIAKQPVNMHEPMIDHVARFLGRRDVLAAKDDVVRKQLHEQVAAMRKNPWAQHGAAQDKLEEPAVAGKEAAPESWEARVSQPSSGQQPQIST